MDERDIYQDVALLFLMFICDKCWSQGKHTTLELEELAESYSYDTNGWDRALGDEGRKRGWHVEYADNFEGYLVLCPACAKARISN